MIASSRKVGSAPPLLRRNGAEIRSLLGILLLPAAAAFSRAEPPRE